MDSYSDREFTDRVNRALDQVRLILDNTRNAQVPMSVEHTYEDKFLLASFLSTSALAAHLNVMTDYLGVSGGPFSQMKEWAATRSVSLRLNAEETCKFLRKATRKVESENKTVMKAGILGKFETYSVTKVTEYFWEFSVKWALLAFQGVDHEKSITLLSHTGKVELITTVEITPRPDSVVRAPIDVNITWLLQHIDETRTPKFSINRESKNCRTPRRNEEVEKAIKFFKKYHDWATQVCAYFTGTIFPVQSNHGIDLSLLDSESVFVPVLPLFEDGPNKIPPVFINSFLAEQARSMEEKRTAMNKTFTQNDKIIALLAAQIVVALRHANSVSEAYVMGVDHIEDMLRKQLVAAIGKEVTPVDFANYLAFHNRKIFAQGYRPQLFSYAVRRPNHTPEGTLSISAKLNDGSISNPISTIVSHAVATRAMRFNINAATQVSFMGDRYLHGFVSHQFAGETCCALSLDAISRQFSSFILLVGRIVSANEFDAKHAIVIQNRDELKIPLELETIPTPKEFKDAIASLSPEQQRFCQAFRSMQLESTLFGVCVIQIKSQLEMVLNLPDDSLTKEIQLTQDLLNLFIKFQIPSDLMSYDGPAHASAHEKVDCVREHVRSMLVMLDAAKAAQLEQARVEQEIRASRRIPCDYDGGVVIKNLIEEGSVMNDKKKKSKSKERKVKGGIEFRDMEKKEVKIDRKVLKRAATPPSLASLPPPSLDLPPPSLDLQRAPSSSQQQLEQHKQDTVKISSEEVEDYTRIPTELEEKFDKFDENNALRPTIINIDATPWSLSHQKSLISATEFKFVSVQDQEKERHKAFDLLDALTKSGALAVRDAALHVIIASTHCFDKSIIQTVIQDNINPIEKVENSSLIVASTIHQTTPLNLIAPEHHARVMNTSRHLITSYSSDTQMIDME